MEIKVLHQVMDWNEDVSEEVKGTLAEHHICMVNVMGSPGASKTSMITTLIGKLRDTFRVGVIEGDIAGQVDAGYRFSRRARRPAQHGRGLPHRGHEHSAYPSRTAS